MAERKINLRKKMELVLKSFKDILNSLFIVTHASVAEKIEQMIECVIRQRFFVFFFFLQIVQLFFGSVLNLNNYLEETQQISYLLCTLVVVNLNSFIFSMCNFWHMKKKNNLRSSKQGMAAYFVCVDASAYDMMGCCLVRRELV